MGPVKIPISNELLYMLNKHIVYYNSTVPLFQVCLTKVHLRVSPNIIELLNRAYVTMYGVSEHSLSQSDTTQDYSRLWDYKPYRETDYWFFRTGKFI